jgi:hydroxyethylthiazole kinase-like uncharacterized protein yjeF
MQPLLTSSQMQNADAYTIKHLPISSIDLMEQAALAFVKIFKKEVKDKTTRIAILCGEGNNGGDGLAIARLLTKMGYKKITVYATNFSTKQSDNFKQNLKRLAKTKVEILTIEDPKSLQLETDIIVDAILGSGLNKPLTGKYEELTKIVNGLHKKVIAVDVPTGLNTEGEINEDHHFIKASLTITFQLPKINFFFPESARAQERFKVVTIGLDRKFIDEQEGNWKLITKKTIQGLIKKRNNFTHKGTYGQALLIAGNTTTMGAGLLAANACLHVGAGLTTVCLPQSGLIALNTALPEVMALPRTKYLAFEALEKFNAVAIGPGLGVDDESEYLFELLIELKKPFIIDADALTILSKREDLLDKLPYQSILTPHMKEFDRLFGAHQTWWERVKTATEVAVSRKLIIVLKNQYTFNCLPSGDVVVNSTGSPAMASGGMGDVLTGMITGLVAQSYTSADAVILATFLHGKAGDELAKKRFIVTANEIAQQIPKTIYNISSVAN